jgi:hypothetical protein
MPHYMKGATTNHLIGNCDECDAHYVASRTFDEVDNWYRQGVIGQDVFEGYAWAWATSAFRYAPTSWEHTPDDPRVRAIGETIRTAAAR